MCNSCLLITYCFFLLSQKHTYHHDDAVQVKNIELVSKICKLLDVKEESFLEALTSKRTVAGGETMVVRYKLEDVSLSALSICFDVLLASLEALVQGFPTFFCLCTLW